MLGSPKALKDIYNNDKYRNNHEIKIIFLKTFFLKSYL